MTISVFLGISVDGFIARPNGDLDFLPEGGGEPHGYEEFIASIDALVIGRKTFETVLAFPTWPYGDKRVVVLSSRPVDLPAVRGGIAEQMDGAPAEIVARLAASGAHKPLHRRRYHDSKIFARGPHSTSRNHTRTGAHWGGDSAVWRIAARCAPPSRGDARLFERPGQK